jgi:hypothetical protein
MFDHLLLDIPPRTEAEDRLCDPFCHLNCFIAPDSYFRESLALLRTIRDCHAEVIAKLSLYLRYAREPDLRSELQSELEIREAWLKKESTKSSQTRNTGRNK